MRGKAALFLSQGDIVLMQDDDDIASRSLIEEHVKTHGRYQQDNFSGFCVTRPMVLDPVMHFVTEVGEFLFSYSDIEPGQVLDFSYFWGGRSSCKRRFLVDHGIFNPVFGFGCEDIELAFGLSKHDLRVVYNPQAVTTMIRGFSFEQFCDRLIRQGRSNFALSQLHPDLLVRRWTEVDQVSDWETLEPASLHSQIGQRLGCACSIQATAWDRQLRRSRILTRNWLAFRASKIKGMASAAASEAVQGSNHSALE